MGFTPHRIFFGVQVKGMRRAWHFGHGRKRKKKIACMSFVGEHEAERLFGRPTRRGKYNVTNFMKKYNERERRWGFLRVLFKSAVSIVPPSLLADLFIYHCCVV
jgi:hypothetical protein